MKPGFLYNLDKLFGLALQLLPDDGAVKKAFMNIIFGPCRILIGPFSLFLGKPDKNLSDELGKLFLIAEKKAKLCRLHLHSLDSHQLRNLILPILSCFSTTEKYSSCGTSTALGADVIKKR